MLISSSSLTKNTYPPTELTQTQGLATVQIQYPCSPPAVLYISRLLTVSCSLSLACLESSVLHLQTRNPFKQINAERSAVLNFNSPPTSNVALLAFLHVSPLSTHLNCENKIPDYDCIRLERSVNSRSRGRPLTDVSHLALETTGTNYRPHHTPPSACSSRTLRLCRACQATADLRH